MIWQTNLSERQRPERDEALRSLTAMDGKRILGISMKCDDLPASLKSQLQRAAHGFRQICIESGHIIPAGDAVAAHTRDQREKGERARALVAAQRSDVEAVLQRSASVGSFVDEGESQRRKGELARAAVAASKRSTPLAEAGNRRRPNIEARKRERYLVVAEAEVDVALQSTAKA